MSKEVIKTWEFNDVSVTTNIGTKIISFKCELEKYKIDKSDITLFEKYILGYRDYFYRIELTPLSPLRQNRDKYYLGPICDEGNDEIENVSLGLGKIERGCDPDLSEAALNIEVLKYVRGLDPEVKKERSKRIKEKKDWRHKTLFRKTFNEYSEEVGVFTSIYKFHGEELSGVTDIIKLSLEHEDDRGIIFGFALFGVHFYFASNSLYRYLYNKFGRDKNKPLFKSGMDWQEHMKQRREWEKKHPIGKLCSNDWLISIGLSRYYGIYFKKEFDGSSWGTRHFNLLRNKLWNII